MQKTNDAKEKNTATYLFFDFHFINRNFSFYITALSTNILSVQFNRFTSTIIWYCSKS